MSAEWSFEQKWKISSLRRAIIEALSEDFEISVERIKGSRKTSVLERSKVAEDIIGSLSAESDWEVIRLFKEGEHNEAACVTIQYDDGEDLVSDYKAESMTSGWMVSKIEEALERKP